MKIASFLLLAVILSAINGYSQAVTRKIHDPRYCLFFDNHTMPHNPEVGLNFDADAFTDRLKECGVDYLTFHARCNMGVAYYNTSIGTRHPSLDYDLFGKLAEACDKKGIALTAYFNAGISQAEGIQHREWTTLAFDGREYRDPRTTPYVRTMCYNTAYRSHLISMVEEVVKNYPVKGLFIDCLQVFYCVCPVCVNMMKEEGIDYTDRAEVGRFSEKSALRLAKDIYDAAIKINPDLLVYHNNPGYEDQFDFSSYFEVECLPTGSWGYEYLPVLSHYVRTLGDRPVLGMTARFYDWGDFGGLRPAEAIRYDLLYGLANGMRPNIGGHFHPRGDMEDPVFERIRAVYNDLQTMEPWFDHAKPLTEIAIVYPSTISSIRNDRQLKSAVRMLCELKQQFDVVTKFSDWSHYKVLVIPDDIIFDDEIAKRVKEHIDRGKVVISSGISGLSPEKKGFMLEKEWGVRYEGECEYDPAYFTISKEYSKDIPAIPVSLYSSGINMSPLPGTLTAARIVKPYYNRTWDGEYWFHYTPPDKVTDLPALTINGKVAHFSHRIFTGYSNQASIELRSAFANVLNSLFPSPMIRYNNLPSFSRVFVTGQPDRKMIHLLSYVPEMRGSKTQMIEEPIELHDAIISFRIDGKSPKKVYLAPSGKSLPFKISGGYVNITIPRSKGYSLIVLE